MYFAAEAAGVDPVLLAGAVGAVFAEITKHQANESPSLTITNYNGPVTVHQNITKANTTKLKTSNQTRRPKEHRVAKDRHTAKIPRGKAPSRKASGEPPMIVYFPFLFKHS